MGSEVARRGIGLDIERVVAYDPYASEVKAAALGVKLVSREEALAQADFFSLHMPQTPQIKVRRPFPVLCTYGTTTGLLTSFFTVSCAAEVASGLLMHYCKPSCTDKVAPLGLLDILDAWHAGVCRLISHCSACHPALS